MSNLFSKNNPKAAQTQTSLFDLDFFNARTEIPNIAKETMNTTQEVNTPMSVTSEAAGLKKSQGAANTPTQRNKIPNKKNTRFNSTINPSNYITKNKGLN
jgi:hypothetical protein